MDGEDFAAGIFIAFACPPGACFDGDFPYAICRVSHCSTFVTPVSAVGDCAFDGPIGGFGRFTKAILPSLVDMQARDIQMVFHEVVTRAKEMGITPWQNCSLSAAQ